MSGWLMIPYIKLFPGKFTFFERPDTILFSEKKAKTSENLKNRENKYNELSVNSVRRLKEKLDIMIFLSSRKSITGYHFSEKKINTEIEVTQKSKHNNPTWFRLSMITLTLSATQHNSDEDIKKYLLHQFLSEARTKWNINNYIWKAEKQENGNIHFHIIVDQYIKHQEIRVVWNRIQNKKNFEYVDNFRSNQKKKYAHGFFPDTKTTTKIETQISRYEMAKKEDFRNPNSTDVHSLRDVRDTAAYLSEYLSKCVTGTVRIDVMNMILN